MSDNISICLKENSEVVLCSTVLGGAEIFVLEKIRIRPNLHKLYVNDALHRAIASDERYSSIETIVVQGLDALSEKISLKNIFTASNDLRSILTKKRTLLANLRAASLALTPYGSKNSTFIHDNTHYLNQKTRYLICAIVANSRLSYFPCHHSYGKLPLYKLFKNKISVEYFNVFKPIAIHGPHLNRSINIALIGRVEPNKNPEYALAIARELSFLGLSVTITLVGSPINGEYLKKLFASNGDNKITIRHLVTTRSGVSEVIAAQDAVIHTSHIESLPLVLFESNSAGVPFFSVPSGGIPEVLPEIYLLNSNAHDAALQIMHVLT